MPTAWFKAFSLSLPVALLILIQALAVTPIRVSAQCPALSAEGGITGITKFNTVKSQMWYNDGLWWGAFSDNDLGIFLYTFYNNTATKGPIIDADIQGRPDVLWDGTQLFVIVWKSVSLATLYKYNYDPATKTHTLISGFPINLTLNGSSTEALVFEKDSTGKIWATYTGTRGGLSDGKVRVIWSTSEDHKVWNTTGVELEFGLAPNTEEISTIVHFDGKIGVAWSNRTASEIAFRYHIDGQPESNWSSKEIIDSGLGPRGLGPVADDHLSIKAAPDGRVFLVAKDSDNDGTPAHTTEGRVWLYTRSTAGTWGSKTIVQPDFSRGSTRPILMLDVSNDRAYVIYHDDSVSGNGLNFITHSPMTNPSFAVPCAFSSMPTNNPTSTKQNVTLNSGLIVAASTGATSANQIVFRHVGLTFSGAGFLCDVAPRPNGNGAVSVADWVQMGRFSAGLDSPSPSEFLRADAIRNGILSISDWVQCGRYAAGLDPITPARPIPER